MIGEQFYNSWVVVDHEGDAAVGVEPANGVQFHQASRAVIVGSFHPQLAGREFVLFKPGERDGTDDLGPCREVDEAMVNGELVREGGPVAEERIFDGAGEEPQPVCVCRRAGDQVQAMASVGEYAVDVDHRQRHRARGLVHAAAVLTLSKTWSVVSICLRPIYRLIVSNPAS